MGKWKLNLPFSAQLSLNYFAASVLMAKKPSNPGSIATVYTAFPPQM